VSKKEIVKALSEEIGLTQLRTKEIVQKTFEVIIDALKEESRVELRNFGVFKIKKRQARRARNPRTGVKVTVSEKYVVRFKPGKKMQAMVRQLTRRAAEAHDRAEAEAATSSEPSTSPADSTGNSHPI
jgi:nucleoid DNA-binding protein